MKGAIALLLVAGVAAAGPAIFPKPQAVEPGAGGFTLDSSVAIALPPQASAADRELAAFLSAELTDRFGLALQTVPQPSLRPGQRHILMRAGRPTGVPAEGYVLEVTTERILITGSDDAGAFYGLQSLRQILGTHIDAQRVRDWPASPFRGIKMYLPGRENIGFFKRFVRDFMAQYKFNRLILEMNAGMRLDRHPEVNAGWLELGRNLAATRRERPNGPRGEQQDSVHWDTADGGILEKAEVADLAAWARRYHIEVIPEIPSLTHSYYLLARHRELAEIPDADWPDTYCPSLAGGAALAMDVMDEYIDVLKPAMVHVGHDEWRIPWGVCQRCKDKDPRQLFADDLNKIYAHLKARGVRTAIWGDHLIEPLRGVRLKDRSAGTLKYQVPGALSPEQVLARIPKDILIFNWFWNDAQPGQGEANDRMLSDWGFQQVYGNMTPGIPNYAARSQRKGVTGGAPSSWAATTPLNFGKDLLDQYLGCASMLWSRESLAPAALLSVIEREAPRIEDSFRGTVRWSALEGKSVPATLPATAAPTGARLPNVPPGEVKSGAYTFTIGPLLYAATRKEGAPDAAAAIAVNQDVSSLIFLHASTARGASRMAYSIPHNFDDTADLLGWYEVVYEDGYTLSVPIRSEVNILEWNRGANSVAYPYQAAAVSLGAGVTFYAWEWTNPRLGKVIREVRLKGTSGFKRVDGTAISNGVVLAGLSYVPKREGTTKAGQRD